MYAGDFASVPGKLELTVQLTRVMLPFLTMVAVAAAVMGMLNSLHHYFVPALSPAMFNIATIAGAFIARAADAVARAAADHGDRDCRAGRRLRPDRDPVAVAAGAKGSAIAPVFDPRDPVLRRVLILMGPGTIGLAATQVNLFVNTLLATSQGTGAASWLTYAFRLMYLPIGLFGVSIGTAVLPAVSRHAAVGRHGRDPEHGVARARA